MTWLARIALVTTTVAALTAAQPTVADAANGLRPRTPAIFGEVPCMTEVEAGTVMQIEYTVSRDETELSADELPDSRQLQFFALGRLPFDYKLPDYINASDLDRAEANGDNTKPYGADDVLRSAGAWPASSFIAITADDARVPITAEQAAMGVAWDTTDVTPGAWVIAGYTWEPENNLWSFRMGVVRVVDPADPDAAGPAAFFAGQTAEPTGEAGAQFPISACVAAAPGSTYTASVGVLEGIDEPAWIPFAQDVAVEGDTLALSPVLPPEAAGKAVKFRLQVTDPDGNATIAYSPFPLTVLPGSGDGADDDRGGDGGRCSVTPPPDSPMTMFCLLLVGLICRPRSR